MVVALRNLDDIQTIVPQGINVAIDGLPFHGDIVGLQIGLDLIGRNCVLLIGILEQVLHDVDDLQFLKRRTRHIIDILSFESAQYL